MDVVIGERHFWRDEWEPFGLSVADRWQHVLLLGKTGVGKSTLLRNLLIQDIQAGRGVLFIDPHGDEAERLLDYVPPWRTDDVIYLDLSDLSRPIGFNVLEREPAERWSLRISCRSSGTSGRTRGAPARNICCCVRSRRSSTTPTGRGM